MWWVGEADGWDVVTGIQEYKRATTVEIGRGAQNK